MVILSTTRNKSLLKAAIKQTARARANKGTKADQLYLSTYEAFAKIVKGDLVKGEALYNWGFALLHQAKTKDNESSILLYLDAISKFTFCLLVSPNHLGAAIDGGVAYMDMARILNVDTTDELYDLAQEFFDNAERIQKGSAAYNLACIFGLQGQEKACLNALELSNESGSLPETEDIIIDPDMLEVINTPWFSDFMERVTAEPEPEIVDENAIIYNVEGKIVNKKKRKRHEFESDGVVYDEEGNVIRRIEPITKIKPEDKIKTN